jgi:hypothetical protein
MADSARLVHDFESPFGAVSKTCDGIADHVRTRRGTFVPSRVVIWQIDARGTGMGTLADSEYITGHGGKLYDPQAPMSVRCRTLELFYSRSLARGGHRPTAIERDLLEQAAMIISPMSALKRITDSSRTSRRVRKVPIGDIVGRLFDHPRQRASTVETTSAARRSTQGFQGRGPCNHS